MTVERGRPKELPASVRIAHTEGRFGAPQRNEDRVVIADPFFAVIDGGTAKSRFVGESPGRRAAAAIEKAIRGLASDTTARECVDGLTYALAAEGSENGQLTASVLMLSLARNEVWVVGDGWVSVDGVTQQFCHETEARAAAARAALLRAELERVGPDALLASDPGRLMITPLLKAESLLSNVDSDDPLCFGRIDGRRVPDRFVRMVRLPTRWQSVVLASDGYPELAATFDASEEALRERIERDPLMIGAPPMTKGVAPGQVSFDDRSWLEVTAHR